MSKKKAVFLHFLFSLIVVSGLMAIIFFIWYPAPFFRINGAENVLRTLIGVDLVLGPALTLYLYRPGKKGLWIDMWFIAIVQLSALVYGTFVIYNERPQYMVFSVDRFTVLAGRDLRDVDGEIDVCPPAGSAPCVVVAQMPDDLKEREDLMFRALEGGVQLEQLPRYWSTLASTADVVLERAEPLQRIAERDSAWQDDIDRLLARHARDAASLRYVPVVNKDLDGFALVIDARTAQTVDVLLVDPWEIEK